MLVKAQIRRRRSSQKMKKVMFAMLAIKASQIQSKSFDSVVQAETNPLDQRKERFGIESICCFAAKERTLRVTL